MIIVYDTVYFVRNGADSPRCPTCRFAAMSHVMVVAVSRALRELLRLDSGGLRTGEVARGTSARPVGDSPSFEVVMKYLRYKFCGILRSVYVFFFQNKTIDPLKKKKKMLSRFFQARFPYRDFKRDWHRGDSFVVVDRLKCDFIVI